MGVRTPPATRSLASLSLSVSLSHVTPMVIMAVRGYRLDQVGYRRSLQPPSPPGSGGVSLKFGGGVPQYSILMYPAVFRCILLKYCILAYSDVFQNVFSYLLVCDRDTLCFMYFACILNVSYASAGHLAVRGVRHLTVLAELRVCALGVKP